MDKERALKLAHKLAAINNGNATEAEALLAAEHLARIAAEHGLSRLDWTKEEVAAKVNSDRAEFFTDRCDHTPVYIQLLLSRMGQSFGCRCIIIGKNLVDIIGDETNVTLMKFFLVPMIRLIPKLRWKARREQGITGQNALWKQSWEFGFINSIGVRFDQIMSQITAEEAKATNALILITDALIKDAISKKYPNLEQSTPFRKLKDDFDVEAYQRGFEDASKVSLQENLSH